MKFTKAFWILTVAIVFLLLTGCTGTTDPNENEGTETGEITINLYFSDSDAQYLVADPVQMTNPSPKDVIQQLINGPTDEALIRTMPENIKVKDINIDERIAYVDFSKEMGEAINGDYGTSTASQLLLYSIVNTLTLNDQFEIDEVKILVEGEDIGLGPFGKIGPQKPNLDIIKP